MNFFEKFLAKNFSPLLFSGSLIKYPGIIKPALFYNKFSNSFEIRDVFHKQKKLLGSNTGLKDFLYKCTDSTVCLNWVGFWQKNTQFIQRFETDF